MIAFVGVCVFLVCLVEGQGGVGLPGDRKLSVLPDFNPDRFPPIFPPDRPTFPTIHPPFTFPPVTPPPFTLPPTFTLPIRPRPTFPPIEPPCFEPVWREFDSGVTKTTDPYPRSAIDAELNKNPSVKAKIESTSFDKLLIPVHDDVCPSTKEYLEGKITHKGGDCWVLSHWPSKISYQQCKQRSCRYVNDGLFRRYRFSCVNSCYVRKPVQLFCPHLGPDYFQKITKRLPQCCSCKRFRCGPWLARN